MKHCIRKKAVRSFLCSEAPVSISLDNESTFLSSGDCFLKADYENIVASDSSGRCSLHSLKEHIHYLRLKFHLNVDT